nr:MAG TPA: hypothetical protein [Caudoviricetes sp.]
MFSFNGSVFSNFRTFGFSNTFAIAGTLGTTVFVRI